MAWYMLRDEQDPAGWQSGLLNIHKHQAPDLVHVVQAQGQVIAAS